MAFPILMAISIGYLPFMIAIATERSISMNLNHSFKKVLRGPPGGLSLSRLPC